MIHLDTHVVVWLAGGRLSKLPAPARALIEAEPVAVSPMVEVELAVLSEIGRIGLGPIAILDRLRQALGLIIDAPTFYVAAAVAATPAYAFARDPFDRLISAHAGGLGVPLITADEKLRSNLDFCVWD